MELIIGLIVISLVLSIACGLIDLIFTVVIRTLMLIALVFIVIYALLCSVYNKLKYGTWDKPSVA